MQYNELIHSGCEYVDDVLAHKNGFKYKDKYIGPSGEWVYVYTDPRKVETGTDILTGKKSETVTPETRHYYRNSNRWLSKTTTIPNLHGGRNSYHDIGRIERGVRTGGKTVGDGVERGLNRAANTVSRTASRAGSAAYNTANRASGGRLGAKVHRIKSDINEIKYAYKQAKKGYAWYKKNKKYIDAGAKFILSKYK